MIAPHPGKSVEIIPFSSAISTSWAPTWCLRLIWEWCGSSGDSVSRSISVGFNSVDRIPCRCICRWPMCVEIAFGRCFQTVVLVSPGHEVKKPLSMALHHVSSTGYPVIAWRSTMTSLAAFCLYKLCAKLSPFRERMLVVLLLFLVVPFLLVGYDSRLTVQRLVAGSRFPLSTTISLLSVTVTQCRLNSALQPESQSFGIERR